MPASVKCLAICNCLGAYVSHAHGSMGRGLARSYFVSARASHAWRAHQLWRINRSCRTRPYKNEPPPSVVGAGWPKSVCPQPCRNIMYILPGSVTLARHVYVGASEYMSIQGCVCRRRAWCCASRNKRHVRLHSHRARTRSISPLNTLHL